MQTETTALVPVVKLDAAPEGQGTVVVSGNTVSAANALMGIDDKPFYCSFDFKKPETEAMLFRVAQGSDENIMAMINMQIEIEHVYMAHASKINPETGELNEFIRIVLISPEGIAYQCFSQGVRKSIALLAATRGLPPFRPPVRVVVKLQQLGTGRNWLTLELPTAPKEGKAKAK